MNSDRLSSHVPPHTNVNMHLPVQCGAFHFIVNGTDLQKVLENTWARHRQWTQKKNIELKDLSITIFMSSSSPRWTWRAEGASWFHPQQLYSSSDGWTIRSEWSILSFSSFSNVGRMEKETFEHTGKLWHFYIDTAFWLVVCPQIARRQRNKLYTFVWFESFVMWNRCNTHDDLVHQCDRILRRFSIISQLSDNINQWVWLHIAKSNLRIITDT